MEAKNPAMENPFASFCMPQRSWIQQLVNAKLPFTELRYLGEMKGKFDFCAKGPIRGVVFSAPNNREARKNAFLGQKRGPCRTRKLTEDRPRRQIHRFYYEGVSALKLAYFLSTKRPSFLKACSSSLETGKEVKRRTPVI